MMGGPPAQQYNGSQYTPVSEPALMTQSQAGWGAPPPAVAQSMPMQMHNNVYMPPGTMPPQMAPGMHFPNHGALQPASTMPTYGSDRTQ